MVTSEATYCWLSDRERRWWPFFFSPLHLFALVGVKRLYTLGLRHG